MFSLFNLFCTCFLKKIIFRAKLLFFKENELRIILHFLESPWCNCKSLKKMLGRVPRKRPSWDICIMQTGMKWYKVIQIQEKKYLRLDHFYRLTYILQINTYTEVKSTLAQEKIFFIISKIELGQKNVKNTCF